MTSRTVHFSSVLGAALALAACAADPEPIQPPVGGVVTMGTGGMEVGGFLVGTGGVVATGGVTATGGAVITGTGGEPAGADGLPCEIKAIVEKHCATCHGATPIGGAPMALLVRDDFMGMAKGPTSAGMTMQAVIKDRINRGGAMGVMPQGAPMAPDELAALNTWLDAGMPAATQDCGGGGTGGIITGTGGMEGTGGSEWTTEVGWPGGVKPEETCYQFLKHGVSGDPNDTSPHVMRPVVEDYVNFYYAVPWKEKVVATRWRTIYDQTQILHHWLLYDYPPGRKQDGAFESTVGSHIGENVQLVAGWAVGGNDEDFPEGVSLRMPEPGGMFMLEWHLYDTTGLRPPDRSGIEICVVPETAVHKEYIAGLTWVGTEDLFTAPNSEAKSNGICTPGRKPHYPGVDPNSDITVVKWLPHMHTAGRHMESWILRADGTKEKVFDEPFQFDRQISYNQLEPLTIKPGDRLKAQCTFFNETSGPIWFGPSTDSEMCYQFTVAYPAGMLDNAVNSAPSLTGASNTCISPNNVPE